jgi:acetyl-CoA carboxylase carboxyl transferase subunit beta
MKEDAMNESLWTRCNNCQRILYKQDILDNLYVCPACSFHFRISSTDRLAQLFDDGRFELVDENIYPVDILKFVDSKPYGKRLEENQARTGLSDAIQTGVGTMGGIRTIVLSMEFGFMGGSVASVVGEKFVRASERAIRESCPLIAVSCSGGMRMQEGMMALMQMIKSSAAVALLGEAKIPFISVMADPTTGGTVASFAMLGDINIGEPQAHIGFAGPRVIEQTIKEKLPKGFQKSEYMLAHGMLDDIIERKNMRAYLIRALRLFLNKAQ